jgi:hypothetical protein
MRTVAAGFDTGNRMAREFSTTSSLEKASEMGNIPPIQPGFAVSAWELKEQSDSPQGQRIFEDIEGGVMKARICSLAFVMVALIGLQNLSRLAVAQSWNTVQLPFAGGSGDFLLTDGRVLMQEKATGNWWILTPEQYTLDYHKGTFAATGSLPAGYAPEFYASAVLNNGKVILEGGEYNSGVKDWTTLGAIFDPISETWSSVAAPPGWTKIGDAPSVVLADGTFMLGTCCGTFAATLDPKTMVWTKLSTKKGYVGKFDHNSEEGWTLLPNGSVLTVDASGGITKDLNSEHSEYYDPTLGQWFDAGDTPVQLWDSGEPCGKKPIHEIGPAPLMMNGQVFATGANECGAAGHTAIYNTTFAAWQLVAGPDFPGANDAADAPAAVAIDGTVLVDTNPGWGKSPSTFYSFDGTGFTDVTPPGFPATVSTEGARMLVLPSGGILVTQFNQSSMWIYEPAGTYDPSWQPQITGCYPATAYINNTYKVCGTQFNGLNQGSYYGDDSQNSTNYPIVVFTNDATGHRFFARTHDFTSMGVATGGLNVTASFDVLPGTETGNTTMVVIANGIPSPPVGILISDGK